MTTIDAIRFVSDDNFAAIAGGRMNIPRPDTQPQNGVPGNAPHWKAFDGRALFDGLIVGILDGIL